MFLILPHRRHLAVVKIIETIFVHPLFLTWTNQMIPNKLVTKVFRLPLHGQQQRGASIVLARKKYHTSVRKPNSKAFPQLEQSDYLFSGFWCCRCATSSGKLPIGTGAHACEKEEYRPWRIATSCRGVLRTKAVFVSRSRALYFAACRCKCGLVLFYYLRTVAAVFHAITVRLSHFPKHVNHGL